MTDAQAWVTFAQQSGIAVAVLVAFFFWATKVFIPGMQQQYANAISSFEKQMDSARELFREQQEKERHICSQQFETIRQDGIRREDQGLKREERMVSIVEAALPKLAETVSSVTKIMLNHDAVFQRSVQSNETAHHAQMQEHKDFQADLKGLKTGLEALTTGGKK